MQEKEKMQGTSESKKKENKAGTKLPPVITPPVPPVPNRAHTEM